MSAIPAIIKSKEFVVDDLLKRYNAERLQDKVNELSKATSAFPNAETIAKLVATSMELGVAKYAEVEKEGIDLLVKENKALACTLVEMEGDKAAIDELIEEMAEIVGKKVNGLLDGYKIQMYDIQKNGDRVPDCNITDMDGVKFATLSNSARLRANIAVQNMFRKVLDVDMITWIDESSIFDSEHLPKPAGQVCYLFAGESDTLVVE